MTLDEFWNGSPHLVKYYREAHRLKTEEQNQMAWLTGLYIKSALDSSLSVSEFFRPKGSKVIQYIEKPLDLFGKTEEEKKREAIKERQKAVEYFNKLIRQQEAKKKLQNKGDEIDGGHS